MTALTNGCKKNTLFDPGTNTWEEHNNKKKRGAPPSPLKGGGPSHWGGAPQWETCLHHAKQKKWAGGPLPPMYPKPGRGPMPP